MRISDAITMKPMPQNTATASTRSGSLIGEIQAYAGQVSVQRGEALDLYVSTMTDGAKYDADIYRMGWYGGAGARFEPPRWLGHGDVVRIEIDGLGTLSNRFIERAA